MSITFSVFPFTKNIPSFREALELSTKKINKYLSDYQINFEAKFEVKLLAKDKDKEQKIELNSLAKWTNDFYVWFSVSSIDGGTDTYYLELTDEEKFEKLEEVLSRVSNEKQRNLVTTCLENKIEWNFRRSVGQHAITNVAYGFIASSFAELTEGVIYSDDGGWDYQIFPSTAKEFDAVYFRPEMALSEEFRKWSIDCLENI